LGQDVDLGRRKLAKAGVAAPVLMTLASKPVFGAQCLLQMMSGNTSQQDGSCSLGWSSDDWCNEGGTVNSVPTSDAWSDAGFTMGTKNCQDNGNCTYHGGSQVEKDTPFSHPAQHAANISILEVITDPAIDQELRHCLTAYLNASLSEKVTNFNYILTKSQVFDLCSGGALPLPYTSLTIFLGDTWS